VYFVGTAIIYMTASVFTQMLIKIQIWDVLTCHLVVTYVLKEFATSIFKIEAVIFL
jgi:hypothetical protein